MEKEIWKDVVGYEGLYKVSNTGKVFSLERHGTKNRLMCAHDNGKGYYRVKMSKNDISKSHMLHRIIAEAFIPNLENKKCVNHINGNKKDNRIENLEWCTHSENVNHAIRTGLKKIKPLPGMKVINIKSGKIFISINEAAREKGIDRSHLSLKLRGKIKNNTEYRFL